MKNWKKGALYGAVIGLILAFTLNIFKTFIYIFLRIVTLFKCEGNIFFSGPQGGGFDCIFSPFGKLFIIITSLILYILIGILIGWIYGKTKSRK